MGIEELSENIKNVVKEAVDNFLDLLGTARLNENLLDQLVTETDFVPNDENHNNFISHLVINKAGIVLWTRDRHSHSNTWYWKKRDFEGLEDYVEFATNYIIDTMVERKIFEILRESCSDKRKEGLWKNFLGKTEFDTIKKNQNKIKNIIQNDLISERELYFQSKGFQETKSDFENCRKSLS